MQSWQFAHVKSSPYNLQLAKCNGIASELNNVERAEGISRRVENLVGAQGQHSTQGCASVGWKP